MNANIASAAAVDPAENFVRHRGPVTCAAGIPGRRAAVMSGYDSAISYVDLERRTIELLGYHEHLANRIVVSPDGRQAASCSSDYTICLWDLERRRPLRVLRGHWDDVEDFAFVDEKTGVSASRDHRVLVWDLASGAVRRTFERHEKDVLAVVHAEGRVYSSGDDMTLREWDLSSAEQRQAWGPFTVETDTCAIDPARRRAVLGADDGCVYVFDTGAAGNDPLARIEAHASGIKKVAVSPTTGDILSAAYDQRLLIWHADSFTLAVELEKHPGIWERSLNFSPDGNEVYAGTFDGTLVHWNAKTGSKLGEIGAEAAAEPGNACLNDLSANADGDVAVVSDDGYVRLGRLKKGEAHWVGRTAPASGRVLMNAVTLDGDRVIAGAHDHKLHFFRRAGDALIGEREIALGEGPINCVRVAQVPAYRGETFAACYSHAVVRVSQEGEVLGKICLHDGAVKALRLHPSRPLGVSCGADGLLLAWDFEGNLVERFLGHMAIIDDVDMDPAGTRIASSGRDFTLKVYELDSARMLASFNTGRQSPKSLCFWDQNTVIVGNYWGYLVKADLDSGQVSRVRIGPNGISSLTRSGDLLVAACYDGAAYLVQPEDLKVVGELRAMRQKVPHQPVTSA